MMISIPLKTKYFWAFSFFCFVIGNLHSQDCDERRYLDSLYAIQLTEDIHFANVEAIIYPPGISEVLTIQKELEFDLYEPEGDLLEKRPLMIMAFGGSFLGGNKRHPQLVEFCQAMTQKGFVVASIDYRIGFNVTSTNSAIRAVYRATQDMNAAIRYFKGNAETYRIDTSMIFSGGHSAGSIAALHAAFGEEHERDTSELLAASFTEHKLDKIYVQ